MTLAVYLMEINGIEGDGVSVNEKKGLAVVLAAGRSTRFKTGSSKLLKKICGRPMISYVIDSLERLGLEIVVVLGYQGDLIKKTILSGSRGEIKFVTQAEALGTGDAFRCSRDHWNGKSVFVMNADVPLVSPESIKKMLKLHEETNHSVTFASTTTIAPHYSYGRVFEFDGKTRIVEEKDCTEEQQISHKVNAGLYIFDTDFASSTVNKLTKNNAAHEFYLTDLVNIASDTGRKVTNLPLSLDEVRGVNTLEELWAVEQIKRASIIKHWMGRGVHFEMAQNTHVDADVEIGENCFIGSGVLLKDKTRIKNNCRILASSIIKNSKIDENTTINPFTMISDSRVGFGCTVGPYARVEEYSSIMDEAVVGNFVELKRTTFGERSKAKHLAYMGDVQVGTDVNIGAGTIACNWDGVNKNRTVIGNGTFIGSNNTLLAPVNIGKKAFLAAGSTITSNVPDESLAIARQHQIIKIGYVPRLYAKLRSKKKHESPDSSQNQENKEGVHFVAAVSEKASNKNL